MLSVTVIFFNIGQHETFIEENGNPALHPATCLMGLCQPSQTFLLTCIEPHVQIGLENSTVFCGFN